MTAIGAGIAVLAVSHAASPRGLLPQVHGFSRPVGSLDADLRPVAVALLALGLAGIAATALLWVRGARGAGPRSPHFG